HRPAQACVQKGRPGRAGAGRRAHEALGLLAALLAKVLTVADSSPGASRGSHGDQAGRKDRATEGLGAGAQQAREVVRQAALLRAPTPPCTDCKGGLGNAAVPVPRSRAVKPEPYLDRFRTTPSSGLARSTSRARAPSGGRSVVEYPCRV